MADEKFKKWSERYKKGEIKTAAMPPLPAGPASVGRMAVQGAAAVTRPLIGEAIKRGKSLIESAAKGGKTKAAAKPKRGGTGTFTDKLGATRTRPRTEKESNKFGPLAKRQENLPATRGSRAVVKREENLPATQDGGSRALTVVREGKKDLQKYNPGGRSVATQGGRTFGDKGQSGRIVGLSNRGKLAAGAAGVGAVIAGAAAYKKAGGAAAKSDKENPQTVSGGKTDSESKASDFRSKQQGRKVPGSPTSKENLDRRGTTPSGPKKAGDKSRAAKKPLTNFERMKMRGYEKEGLGGRSMTSSGAKARVEKERGYKFKDLFKKK